MDHIFGAMDGALQGLTYVVSGWGEWGMMTDLLDRGISVRGRISGGDGGRLVVC